jgi:hypothetical protein
VKLFFLVKFFQLKEQLRVILHYYRSIRFAVVDLAFCVSAFFSNPYRMCRKFTGAHSYGETPISTFAKMVESAEVTAEDRFVDLGSGRGKLCFWLALWVGCSCTGIEQVPGFVHQAKFLARLFRVPARFHLASIQSVNLSDATVVYLYTMEWDETLLLQMARGARLITIGAPVANNVFQLLHTLRVAYPWGTANAYIQRRL